VRLLTTLALRYSVLVVVAFALATVFLGYRATQVTTDGRTDALYPPRSEAALLDDELAIDFSQGERLLMVVEGDIWTPDALEALKELTREIDRLEGTRDVTSLATAQKLEDDDGFLIVSDLIPEETDDVDAIDEAARYLAQSDMYSDVTFVSDDGRRASLIIEYEDEIDAATYVRTVAAAADESWPNEYALAGAAFTTMELQDIIARDLPVLGAIALALIVAMLWLNFRTARRTALSLIQILIGVIWGMGIFQLLGQELMALTVIGPIAVMAVGASFSMHLLGRYDYELASGTEKMVALQRTFQRTGLGVGVSGLAISAAMSTFLLSELAMVRGLGLIAALGVLSSLVAALLLLPALLKLLPDPARVPDPEAPGGISGLLRRLAWLDTNRTRSVLVAAALLVVALHGRHLVAGLGGDVGDVGCQRRLPRSGVLDPDVVLAVGVDAERADLVVAVPDLGRERAALVDVDGVRAGQRCVVEAAGEVVLDGEVGEVAVGLARVDLQFHAVFAGDDGNLAVDAGRRHAALGRDSDALAVRFDARAVDGERVLAGLDALEDGDAVERRNGLGVALEQREQLQGGLLGAQPLAVGGVLLGDGVRHARHDLVDC